MRKLEADFEAKEGLSKKEEFDQVKENIEEKAKNLAQNLAPKQNKKLKIMIHDNKKAKNKEREHTRSLGR